MIRRVTAPGLFPPPACSHAGVVEAGGRPVFLAGAVPPEKGEVVGPDDPVRQARQVIANVVGCLGYTGQPVEITATAVVPEEVAR